MSAFDDLLFGFREHLRVTGYSPASVATYTEYLRGFFAHLEETGARDIKRVTRDHLQVYRLRLAEHRVRGGRGYSVSALCLKVRAVRRLFEYLEATNRILVNPAEAFKEPKKEARLPRAVLTTAEARRILDAPDLTNAMGVRDRAMLEVFYSTGIRLAELRRLSIFDCDLQGGLLRINNGKGGKDRVVPLGRHAVKFLKTYLAKVRPSYTAGNRAERCLFVGRFGAPLSEQVVQKMVRNYTRAAGVRKQVSPHTFRHTFATELVRNGAEITAVQRMLGHADLSVTHVYARVAGVEVKKTHRLAHPRERDEAVKEEFTPDIRSVKEPPRRD